MVTSVLYPHDRSLSQGHVQCKFANTVPTGGGGRDARTVSLKSQVPQLLVHELFNPWTISPQTFKSNLILAAKRHYNEFGLVRANAQLPVCEVVSSLSDSFSAWVFVEKANTSWINILWSDS